MKKSLLTFAMIVVATVSFAQTEIAAFVNSSDTLDTLFINQEAIVKVQSTSAGADITYMQFGNKKTFSTSSTLAAVIAGFTPTILFQVDEVSNSDTVAINKNRVFNLEGSAPTLIWYLNERNRNIIVNETRDSIRTVINGL